MFVSTQVTATPGFSLPDLSFTVYPVIGKFTAGQTVIVTASGLIPAPFPVPFQVDLLDEGGTQPLFSTSLQLKPTDGLELFSFVVPTTLR